MVTDGRISLQVNAEKQARHTKGDKLYNQLVESGKHPSYIENTPSELQKIVDNASGGRLIKRKSNAFVRVASDDGFKGTCVDRETGEETRTNRFTIHYSKTGTHVVPTSQEEGEMT